MKDIIIGTWSEVSNTYIFTPDSKQICLLCNKFAQFGTTTRKNIWCLNHLIKPGSWGTYNTNIPEELLEGLKKVLEQYPDLALEL